MNDLEMYPRIEITRRPQCRCSGPDDLCVSCKYQTEEAFKVSDCPETDCSLIVSDAPEATGCERCGRNVVSEHVYENHFRRAEDGDAAPVAGCAECVAAFPDYFRERDEDRAAYVALKTCRKCGHDKEAHSSFGCVIREYGEDCPCERTE